MSSSGKLTVKQFYDLLNEYKLSARQMYEMGYPIRSNPYDDSVVIYKQPMTKTSNVDAKSKSRQKKLLVDTQSNLVEIIKRTCVRCNKNFETTMLYPITTEKCRYHWGKLVVYGPRKVHNCCYQPEGIVGCSEANFHVWNGTEPGLNGPYQGFVHTEKPQVVEADGYYGVYSIDCEMSYTLAGLELTRISVVEGNGSLKYHTYVRPEHQVVDYNTRFSGVTIENMINAKSLNQVQCDILSFINNKTILLGHGLENDLRALKMSHPNVVDTVHCFPHHAGLPLRQSLKTLVSTYLNRDIQCGSGHDSYEDALACMELMLWKVEQDYLKERIAYLEKLVNERRLYMSSVYRVSTY